MEEALAKYRSIVNGVTLDDSVSKIILATAKLEQLELPLPVLNIAVLRNYTFEALVPYLKLAIYKSGFKPNIQLGEYDNATQEALQPDSFLYQSNFDFVLVALRLQTLVPALYGSYAGLDGEALGQLRESSVGRIGNLVENIRSKSKAVIVLNNFEPIRNPAYGILDANLEHGQDAFIQALNLDLAQLARQVSGCYILNLQSVLTNVGLSQAIDDRYWHYAKSPYTPNALRPLANEYAKFFRAIKGKFKKCAVLDCDNTLWGGVIGEEGMAGIKLGPDSEGSPYLDFQAGLLNLYHRGVMLAVASKNNEADALEVFDTHPNSLLKRSHFVARRINWNDKAANIRDMANELNIGLDSMVFFDDNPVEIDLVRQYVPEVEAVLLPKEDPAAYRRILESSGFFDTLTLSEEDRRRTAMYLAQQERETLRTSSGSLDDFLRSLSIKLNWRQCDDFALPRIAQLTQKTNQFNLTTTRYSEEDISRFSADPDWWVHYYSVTDKFDDSGIVGVCITHLERGSQSAKIDSFLMSCRVIGRGIETAALGLLAKELRAQGITTLTGQYLPTAKNALVNKFLPDHGFVAESETDYVADLNAVEFPIPDWITIE